MPRHDELAFQVSMLESKVEFMLETVMTKLDRIYEISSTTDKNQHETELLRQEVSLLRARLYDFESRDCGCQTPNTQGNGKTPNSLKTPNMKKRNGGFQEDPKGPRNRRNSTAQNFVQPDIPVKKLNRRMSLWGLGAGKEIFQQYDSDEISAMEALAEAEQFHTHEKGEVCHICLAGTPSSQKSLWKKLKKGYATKQPAKHLVDVKSIVAKFDKYKWDLSPEASRPGSCALVPELPECRIDNDITPGQISDFDDEGIDLTPSKAQWLLKIVASRCSQTSPVEQWLLHDMEPGSSSPPPLHPQTLELESPMETTDSATPPASRPSKKLRIQRLFKRKS